jgi:hypothetical protein
LDENGLNLIWRQGFVVVKYTAQSINSTPLNRLTSPHLASQIRGVEIAGCVWYTRRLICSVVSLAAADRGSIPHQRMRHQYSCIHPFIFFLPDSSLRYRDVRRKLDLI